MKRIGLLLAVVIGVLIVNYGFVGAQDEEPLTSETSDTSSYSYLSGQQRSQNRNELYAQAGLIEDETQREQFLVENGIADTPYSEEAKANYSYVTGKSRGASYSQD